jgi:hypothetical protein
MKTQPYDVNGNSIEIGTKVKILVISEYLLSKLPSDEVIELKSMIDDTFEVYKIDEWGGVWVEKEFEGETENQNSYHSLSLAPEEMEKIK